MDEEEASASSPFAPRAALMRTPPSGLAPPYMPDDYVTPPTVPARPPRQRTTPPVGTSSGMKRPLTSPEERRPVEVVRMCRPVTPSTAPPVADTGLRPQTQSSVIYSRPQTPEPASDAESTDQPAQSLAKASKMELLDRVNTDLDDIMTAVTGSASRLNKNSMNAIGASVRDTLAVVAALSLRLCEMEAELGRANTRCAEMEKAMLLAQCNGRTSEMGPVAQQSYSAALKLSKKADPVPIPTQQGPVLAFYPAQDQVGILKTAEDTKAELKRAVDPRTIDVQIEKVRKVGNAGVVVQTTNPSAADRLRSAMPPSLRVAEPRRQQPRICLRDVDGNPTAEDILLALQDQNLRGTAWTIDKLRADCKIFKMRGRQHQTTTIIMECSPALRELLLSKGKIYVGWNAVEACDFIRVTCCNKCQTFGHPEKYCRSQEIICGKCGAAGHKKEDCKESTTRCATCHRFGRESGTHKTNDRSCPARLYAEQRAVSTTNYGCP